jgi:hypothetical protein
MVFCSKTRCIAPDLCVVMQCCSNHELTCESIYVYSVGIKIKNQQNQVKRQGAEAKVNMEAGSGMSVDKIHEKYYRFNYYYIMKNIFVLFH